MELVASGKARPESIVSREIGIEEAPEYYRRFSQRLESKVIYPILNGSFQLAVVLDALIIRGTFPRSAHRSVRRIDVRVQSMKPFMCCTSDIPDNQSGHSMEWDHLSAHSETTVAGTTHLKCGS